MNKASAFRIKQSDGTYGDPIVFGLDKSEVWPSTKEIPANADLDDYTSPGVYNCPQNPTSLTIDNQPPDLIISGDSYSAFSLLVFKTTADGCRQIYAPYHLSPKYGSSTSITRTIANNADRFFTRTYDAGEWGSWTEILTSKTRPSKYTLVGNNSSTVLESTPWFKVATVSFTNSNNDKRCLFMVTDSYYVSGTLRADQRFGILRLQYRTAGSNTGATFLEFLLNNRYNTADFKAVFNTTTGEVELWTKCDDVYNTRLFTLIQEGTMNFSDRWVDTINPVTMYGRLYGLTNNMAASYPTGEGYVVKNSVNIPIKNVSSGVQDQGFVRSATTNYSRLTTANDFLAGNGLLEYYNSTSSISLEDGAFTYPDGTRRDAHVLRLPWDSVGNNGACYDSMLAVPNSNLVNSNGYPCSLGWRTGYGAGCAERDADGNWIQTTYSDWYHLIDDRYTIDGVHVKKQHTTHYGVCSTAAATVAKTVDIPHFELIVGAIAFVRFSVTNTGAVASLTLNISNTGAKPIKYRNANLSAANVLSANRTYLFVYDGTNWQIVGDLDTNTNNYDRVKVAGGIYPKSNITTTTIAVNDGTGYFSLATGSPFNISFPIVVTSSAFTAGSMSANAYIQYHFAIANTQDFTMTQHAPVYIKGILNGVMFTPVSNTPLVQILPNTEDGYQYIYLGYAYSTTNIQLVYTHPIVEYVNGAIRPYHTAFATNADIDAMF